MGTVVVFDDLTELSRLSAWQPGVKSLAESPTRSESITPIQLSANACGVLQGTFSKIQSLTNVPG
jgi:nitrogen fixation/metabolism regulation signal transduction histidine kinase